MKPGDVVQLKSGGPAMTVDSLHGDEVLCVWFANEQPMVKTFVAATLVPYVAPSFADMG